MITRDLKNLQKAIEAALDSFKAMTGFTESIQLEEELPRLKAALDDIAGHAHFITTDITLLREDVDTINRML